MSRQYWWMCSLMVGLMLTGCARQQSASQSQQPEVLSLATASAPVLDDTAISVVGGAAATAGDSSSSMPATAGEIGGPIEIQTALANAGYYSGPIDGKVGPMTQQAIQEFQRASSLNADGKVGPKTWAALKSYLASQPSPQPQATQ